MFDLIKNFIANLGTKEEPESVVHSRKQIAEAALMYHVISVDGIVREEERERFINVLASRFGLDADETRSLVMEGRDAEKEAIDLYQFTSILKRSFDEDERTKIIENLWEMVFADGMVHELEDNVIWRIAELLNVESRTRLEIKQRVWKNHKSDQDES